MVDNQRKLDIGCSFYKLSGYIGIDVLSNPNLDLLADARQMPFKNNVFSEIYSSYALEHIDDNLGVLSEIWRVSKPDASVRLILPHFSNPSYYDDLTHKHLYSTRSFEHFDHELHKVTGHPNYLPSVNFKVTRAELRWWPPQVVERKSWLKRTILKTLNKIINFFANLNPFLCERIWCRWVGGFYEVDFKLIVKKL